MILDLMKISRHKNLVQYDNLKNLTVIVPSYSRQEFILRQILHWHGSGATLIIIDGSESSFDVSFQEEIDKLNDVVYIHSKLQLNQRLTLAGQLIKSKYAVYCSDDDFLLHSALSNAINVLENDLDLVACMGQSLRFNVLSDNRVTYGTCYSFNNPNLASNNYEDRITAATSNYAPVTCHAVMRSETWKTSWGSIPSYSSSQILEFYQAIAVYLCGKLLIIQDLYLLRTLENLPLSTIDANRSISSFEWWHKDFFGSEKIDLLDKLSNLANKQVHVEEKLIRKFLSKQINSLINSLVKEPSKSTRIWAELKMKINYSFPNFLNSIRKMLFVLRPRTKSLNLGFLSDLKLGSSKNLLITDKSRLDLVVIEELISDFYKAGGNQKH
jgi:glycosyltransferase domain-containing protein